MGRADIVSNQGDGLYTIKRRPYVERIESNIEHLGKVITDIEKEGLPSYAEQVDEASTAANEAKEQTELKAQEWQDIQAQNQENKEEIERLDGLIKIQEKLVEAAEINRDNAKSERDEALSALEDAQEAFDNGEITQEELDEFQADYDAKNTTYLNAQIAYDWEVSELNNLKAERDALTITDEEPYRQAWVNAMDDEDKALYQLMLAERLESIAKLKLEGMKKQLEQLEQQKEAHEDTRDAWCADRTDTLTGEVGTVEVAGEPELVLVKPGYESAAYDPATDGIQSPIPWMTPAQTAFNFAIKPGWQKWKPTFRVGVITALDGTANTATVQLDEVICKFTKASLNQADLLESIPVDYMSCNAAAFSEGDRVLVMFGGQDQGGAKVIGFESEPQACDTDVFARITFHRSVIFWNVTEDNFADIPWDAPEGWAHGDEWPTGWPFGKDYGPPDGWAKGDQWPYPRHLMRPLHFNDDQSMPNDYEIQQGIKFWENICELESLESEYIPLYNEHGAISIDGHDAYNTKYHFKEKGKTGSAVYGEWPCGDKYYDNGGPYTTYSDSGYSYTPQLTGQSLPLYKQILYYWRNCLPFWEAPSTAVIVTEEVSEINEDRFTETLNRVSWANGKFSANIGIRCFESEHSVRVRYYEYEDMGGGAYALTGRYHDDYDGWTWVTTWGSESPIPIDIDTWIGENQEAISLVAGSAQKLPITLTGARIACLPKMDFFDSSEIHGFNKIDPPYDGSQYLPGQSGEGKCTTVSGYPNLYIRNIDHAPRIFATNRCIAMVDSLWTTTQETGTGNVYKWGPFSVGFNCPSRKFIRNIAGEIVSELDSNQNGLIEEDGFLLEMTRSEYLESCCKDLLTANPYDNLYLAYYNWDTKTHTYYQRTGWQTYSVVPNPVDPESDTAWTEGLDAPLNMVRDSLGFKVQVKYSGSVAPDIHRALFRAINEQRVAEGMEPLSYVARGAVFDAANEHSRYVAEETHAPNHDGMESRFEAIAAEYPDWTVRGENVNWGTAYDVDAFVQAWMDSSAHRANILNPDFKMGTISVHIAENGEAGATQMFWG